MNTASYTFGQPAPLLNLNDRDHWATRAARVREWRTVAAWAALQLPKDFRPCPGRILITVTLPVKRMQRRDAHNFVATLKPIIDGLVDARVVPDDDTSHVVTAEPTFHVSDRVVVTITKI
jgi:Holliday junction resolvase RusA-like endonuclease